MYILMSDGELPITSHMSTLHRIVENLSSTINVLRDLINVGDKNISCDGFTRDDSVVIFVWNIHE